MSMPYGGVINWALPRGRSVHDPAVHHGYRHIVAWGVHLGSHAYFIEAQCAKAKEAGAPMDALYLSGSDYVPDRPREWQTFEGLKETNPRLWEQMNTYIDAMKKLEKKAT